jgi:hypothetical protein
MEPTKKPRGRPPLPEAERLEQRSIRLPKALWFKIEARGGIEWLRTLIQKAKEK